VGTEDSYPVYARRKVRVAADYTPVGGGGG
jgi:hypothetical protein